jgi:mannan endo-1,4-beta-mannosidase
MPFEPGFVKATPSGFMLGQKRFPVVGVNCYFLAYCANAGRQSVLDAVSEMGVNTLRCWGFLEVENRQPGAPAFQYLQNGSITVDTGPDGLERLDALIAAAEASGFRLILPLVNHWRNPLGGMSLYLQWLGVPGGVEEFYRSPVARAAYQNWVQAVITRRNTRTGRAYYDEPAIMAWELANEPRCEVPGGREILLDWIGTMSRFVKTLDGNHLLAAGDEGYLKHAHRHDDLYDGSHGVDCEAILNFGEIDFGTFHFYPESLNRSPDFMETWIRDHVGSGQRANKPMILEEYGVVRPASDRNRIYREWLGSVRSLGCAGDLLWMAGGRTPDTIGFRDDYTIYSVDDVPALKEHATSMLGQPPDEGLQTGAGQ